MKEIIKKLNEEDKISAADIPQLHRMATSYDMYITSCEWLSDHDPIAINKKGEEVKHPHVNIAREAWNQYLLLAREYGLTAKSKAQINSHAPQKDEDESPIKKLLGAK